LQGVNKQHELVYWEFPWTMLDIYIYIYTQGWFSTREGHMGWHT